jgi:hypothetical protein
MHGALMDIVDQDQDQVVVVDLGPTSANPIKSMEGMGRPLWITGRRPLIV